MQQCNKIKRKYTLLIVIQLSPSLLPNPFNLNFPRVGYIFDSLLLEAVLFFLHAVSDDMEFSASHNEPPLENTTF